MSALRNHIRSLPATLRQDRAQVISHELRTPLAIIQGYAQLLGEESEGNLAHLTGPLIEAVNRLERIVEALVDFDEPVHESIAAPAAPTGSRIPLNHLVNRIAQRVRSRHPECRVDLVLDLEGTTSVSASAADSLGRALDAVLDNAVRFTEEGKVILRSRIEDASLKLTILDEGPGLPQGSVSLTAPFQQGSQGMDRRHGGLGLGLHAAKKALAGLKGSMQLQTRTDKRGARVVLSIPHEPARPVLREVRTTKTIRKAA